MKSSNSNSHSTHVAVKGKCQRHLWATVFRMWFLEQWLNMQDTQVWLGVVKSAQISEFPSWQYPCYTSPSKEKERSQTATLGLSHSPSFSLFCWVAVIFVVTKELWGGLCIWCRLFSCGVSHIISAWSYCHVLPVFHTSSKHCACAKGRRAREQLWCCTWYKSEGSSLRGLCGHPGSTAGHSNTAAIAGTTSDIKGFLPCLQLPP